MRPARLGFIGLGDLGLPMARRLLAQGPLTVWNRTSDKALAMGADGAQVAPSAAALAVDCDIIGLCLTSHDAVEAVAFGISGIFDGCDGRRRVIVDFSTGAPDRAHEFAQRAMALGCGWVDAPVSGGVPAAQSGKLIVFAGGEVDDVAQAHPLIAPLAARITHMGPSGAGQTTKLCNQMIVACNMLVIAETIAAARRAGVDVERLPDALRGGFADSQPFQIFGPRMAAHAFTPRLGAVSLMEKDLKLAREMAHKAGGDTPISELCAQLYARVGPEEGLSADGDIATVIGLFERLDAETRA
ncbi:NAD(P)-dependent oxidoreductase [Blastomonas fulva]|uniref:NAD(P)-dependent oxidoreductase n=1 Tax=Blastomonas fulva TaxID=1550728 RepID=UPI003F6EE979